MPKLRLIDRIKAFFLHILELDRYWIMRITAVAGLIISTIIAFRLEPLGESGDNAFFALVFFPLTYTITYRILKRFTTPTKATFAALKAFSPFFVSLLVFLPVDYAETIMNVILRSIPYGITLSVLITEYYLFTYMDS